MTAAWARTAQRPRTCAKGMGMRKAGGQKGEVGGESEGRRRTRMDAQRGKGRGEGDSFTPALSIEFHPSSNTLSSDVDSGMAEQLTSTSALPAIRAKVITLLIKHSCVREEGKGAIPG